MPKKVATKDGAKVVETSTEARAAEPGPSMFVVLTASTLAVVVLFAVVWMAFFHNAA
jgi:hypothetical protein